MKPKIVRGTKENLYEITAMLGSRAKMDLGPVIETVSKVIEDIRANGDEACLKYTKMFDKAELTKDEMIVTKDEIDAALKEIDPDLLRIIRDAASNIREFHEKQSESGFTLKKGKSSEVGLRVRPLDTVGVYVPGGTAPLPSTVLMDLIPASVAGVKRIVFCTPPRKDGTIAPVILAAASIAGATEIYKIGGSQAIAAMAYGTNTIPRVDKICGPGNIYVNTAKRLVFGQVDIDMFAGPSEILILADDTANPKFVAADMLSQSEHDKIASSILLTTSEKLANEVAEFVDELSIKAQRKEILDSSIPSFSAIIVCDDMDVAISFSNEIAPEHLELIVNNSSDVIDKLVNAGAIFIGNYTPEPLGDYYAGPNHTLPTSGTARFFSPLNVGDFIKKISVIKYSEEDLKSVYEDVARFADSEGLDCHANALRIRFEE